MTFRDEFVDFLTANWTETQFYPIDDYVSMDDIPANHLEDIILLVDFPSASERIATIAVNNVNGWRERGLIQLSFISPLGGDNNQVRTISESLRTLLRGRRIGATVVESVDSFTSAGNVDGKWLMWVSFLNFYRDAFQ